MPPHHAPCSASRKALPRGCSLLRSSASGASESPAEPSGVGPARTCTPAARRGAGHRCQQCGGSSGRPPACGVKGWWVHWAGLRHRSKAGGVKTGNSWAAAPPPPLPRPSHHPPIRADRRASTRALPPPCRAVRAGRGPRILDLPIRKRQSRRAGAGLHCGGAWCVPTTGAPVGGPQTSIWRPLTWRSRWENARFALLAAPIDSPRRHQRARGAMAVSCGLRPAAAADASLRHPASARQPGRAVAARRICRPRATAEVGRPLLAHLRLPRLVRCPASPQQLHAQWGQLGYRWPLPPPSPAGGGAAGGRPGRAGAGAVPHPAPVRE